MNPQDKGKDPEVVPSGAPPVVEQALIRQIVEEIESSNPYGFGKYTDEDATFLGLPSLGSMRLAHTMVKQFLGTPFIPKFIANSPNPAGTFVATVLRGNELKFKMFESLGALYLSPDGRLGMYGTAMLALMRKSGYHLTITDLRDEKTGDPSGCTVYGKRPDGDEYTSTFTRADALRAGLTGMHGKYPQYMCKWRAVSDLFRTLASDLSGGPVYTTEELVEEDSNGRGDPERALPAAPEHDPYEVKIPDAAPARDAVIGQGIAEALNRGEDPTGQTAPTLENAPEPPLLKQAPMHPSSAPEPPQVAEMPKKPNPVIGPLMAEIEKLLPVKTRKKIVEEFLRGYFNVGDIKSVLGNPAMVPALEILRALALGERWKTNLAVDPHRFGVDTAAGFDRLWQYVADWPDVLQVQAGKIALRLYPDSGGGELRDYLEDPIAAHSLPFPELAAFLWVLERVEPKDATIFRECAIEMAATAAPWGELTTEELVAAIAALETGPHDEEPGEPGQQSLLEMIRGGEAK